MKIGFCSVEEINVSPPEENEKEKDYTPWKKSEYKKKMIDKDDFSVIWKEFFKEKSKLFRKSNKIVISNYIVYIDDITNKRMYRSMTKYDVLNIVKDNEGSSFFTAINNSVTYYFITFRNKRQKNNVLKEII